VADCSKGWDRLIEGAHDRVYGDYPGVGFIRREDNERTIVAGNGDEMNELLKRGNLYNRTGAEVSITPTLVLVACLVACLWNEFSYFQEAKLWDQRAAWPSTSARIVGVKKSDVSNSPVLRVDFTYNVGGKSYTAEQSDFKGLDYTGIGQDGNGSYTIFANKEKLESVASGFEAYRQPTVHYNSANPEEAFIDVGYSGYSAKSWLLHLGTLISLALLITFVALPAAGYSALPKPTKKAVS